MTPRADSTKGEPAASQYIKLEARLILLAWLNSQFGYRNNRELLADLSNVEEGFDYYGRSYTYHHLIGRGTKVQITPPILSRYDDNIRAHLEAINARRAEPVTLRYFQYLAVLYTEIFLDWYFNRPGELIRVLNDFVRRRNSEKLPGDVHDSPFALADLRKLAFWMATGSGKTLIMHFNYRQFLFYNRKPLDNILLIAPNEGLSEQHLKEMEASGIPCGRFDLKESGLGLNSPDTVRVIEITKLVQEKRGTGVSVPIEAFEGNNLIFVDEGHKGTGGEAWRRFRDALGRTGFTFEYSATFGQALTATRDDVLTAEYGKAIAFDYSYRYFYADGYGKDFHILNLREETTEDKTETLLLGNLLSFYEQQRCFEEQGEFLRPYNLEKPLWVFVGSSVNAVYRESGQPRSDVLTLVRFLHHFVKNNRGWAVRTIAKLIDGKSGLVDDRGEDVFARRFEYIRGAGHDAGRIYEQILSSVFHASGGGALHISDIRAGEGELGLKVSGAEHFFGLVYIGDTASFKKLVETEDSGIVLEEDAIVHSLFGGINLPDSRVNVLVGAKKFMEGWNSWRVSNMGLLNIGRAEGSEIIQLFGRGVRLRGRGYSLKRSAALDGSHPAHIRLLETLSIFAVRANYMAQFRSYLEREGVEISGHVELKLAIQPNAEFLGKGLLVPQVPPDHDFARECDLILVPDDAARVSVDASLKIQSLRSQPTGVKTLAIRSGEDQVIRAESLDLINWDRVYLELLEYKRKKGFANLALQATTPRRILAQQEPRLYSLIAEESVVQPHSFADVSVLEDVALTILRRYMERYYFVCRERWDSRHMVYAAVNRDDPNFRDYTVRISRAETALVEAITKLIEEGEQIYRREVTDLPNIHFDRHLYQPLLIERGDQIRTDPPGLSESEQRFVRDLRQHVRDEASKSLATKEVFLLRNLSRGRGIGFFENEGFYPDFILWVKDRDKQRVVFVEPHGMRQEKTYWTSDKARLHERLRELATTWNRKAGLKGVALDSFIISATPYDDLRSYYGDGTWSVEQFSERHILFQGQAYVAKLFDDRLAG